MQIGNGEHVYEWNDQWTRIPDTVSGKANGRTHGVVVSKTGDILVFNQADPGVLVFDADGGLKNAWGDRFGGAHGMTLIEEDGAERLWLTDQNSKEVVKTTLEGETIQTLDAPPSEVCVDNKYVPTWVAIGPDGDILVADGYGSSLVHRYDPGGAYQSTLNGEEGAGRFRCPHGLMFSPEGELYIADRGNHRVTVYDADGGYLRHNDDATHSPCGFVFHNGLTYLPELFAGVKALDKDFNVVANLGDNFNVKDVEGWPNLAETEHVQPGRFNSPHGIAVAPNGDIYVVEWIIGGRITKLAKR